MQETTPASRGSAAELEQVGADGFWLYFKRLEKRRFRWLSSDESWTMTLFSEELHLLLGSPRVMQKLKRQEVRLGAVI